MMSAKFNNRGIALPPIKLNEIKKCGSASLLRSDLGRATVPAWKHETAFDAGSPVGYTLKHSDEHTFSHDAVRGVKSESFTKVNTAQASECVARQVEAIAPEEATAVLDKESAVVIGEMGATPEEEILDIRVFFPNGKAIQFSVEGGALICASELLGLMAEHLQIDSDVAAEAFALWLISPLLEVQLKPHHVAFEVHQKWPVFLRRFAIADEEEIVLDEPLLVIRRNFQLTIDNERLYMDEYERLAEILYLDARDQYLTGRYLLDIECAVELAALQLAIDFGTYDSAEQAMDLIQEHLGQLVPAQHLSTMRTFRLFGIAMIECKSGMENELMDEFRRVSNLYANNHERRKAFLAILQNTPFYGAAFFTGLRDCRSSLFNTLLNPLSLRGGGSDLTATVTVGINHEFITVVNPVRHELITCQPIANCHWRRTNESSKYKKGVEIPLFVLEHPDGSTLAAANHKNHNDFTKRHLPGGTCQPSCSGSISVEFRPADSETVTIETSACHKDPKVKPLVNRQIFSKQAAMMEALLNSVCNEVYGKFNVVK